MEEYLEVLGEGTRKLEILQKYRKMHHIYSIEDLNFFCRQFYDHCLDFGIQTCTISEILYNCGDVLDKLFPDVFILVIGHCFVVRNGLAADFYASSMRMRDFLRFLTPRQYKFCIRSTRQVIKMVNSGEIHFSMTECQSSDLELNKNTFESHISGKIDMAALMAYQDLSSDEIYLLSSRIRRDQKFKLECRSYIEFAGPKNATMHIIGILCDAKLEKKHQFNLRKYYCIGHGGVVYQSCKTFTSIGKFTRHYLYYLYLANRTTLDDDIEDAIAMVNEPAEESAMDAAVSVSVKAEILGLLFSRGLYVTFDRSAFVFLNELRSKVYFDSVCKAHARDIIENKVFSRLPAILEDMATVIAYLNKCSRRYVPECSESDFSFDLDTFLTPVTESISKHVPVEVVTRLPLIKFSECCWLTSGEKVILLRIYLPLYDISDLVENLLDAEVIPEDIRIYFLNNMEKIASNKLRATVFCVLGVDAEIELTGCDAIRVLQCVKSAYPIRKCFQTKKMSKAVIQRFLGGLEEEEADLLLIEIGCIPMTVEFACAFVSFIGEKYEFSHIFSVLEYLASGREPRVIIKIQKYLIGLFSSKFVQKDYLFLVRSIYSIMVEFDNRNIKKNNDKILLLIAKAGGLLGVNVHVGHLREGI